MTGPTTEHRSLSGVRWRTEPPETYPDEHADGSTVDGVYRIILISDVKEHLALLDIATFDVLVQIQEERCLQESENPDRSNEIQHILRQFSCENTREVSGVSTVLPHGCGRSFVE